MQSRAEGAARPMPAQRAAVLLMVGASFMMATMGLAVRLASGHYSTGEVAMYRGAFGAVLVLLVARQARVSLRTPIPRLQFSRSFIGAVAMICFFYAIGRLPLGTAITLNYTSSLWIALLVVSGIVAAPERGDRRLVLAAVVGFAGVALVLRPTIEEGLLLAGLAGLVGGMLSGIAHLQVAQLGRLGEPALRTIFYFSVGNLMAGGAVMAFEGRVTPHTLTGVGLLLAMTLCATVGQWMLTQAYACGSAMVNASLQYLSIAWAFVYGVLLFGDPVRAGSLVGIAAIVLAGVGASLARLKPAAVRPPASGG